MLDVNSGRNPYAISAKLHSHYLFGSGVAAKCQTIQKKQETEPQLFVPASALASKGSRFVARGRGDGEPNAQFTTREARTEFSR